MHQLLNIDYILHQICSYVPRHELPALARISSAWFRYAISHLYRHIGLEEALAPLGKIVRRDGTMYSMEFVNSPRDKDLERLSKYYPPYVRVLYVRSRHKSIAFQAIRKSVSKGIPHLFPNIRTLNFFIDNSPECIEISIGLISPKIDRLSLEIKDGCMVHYFCSLIMTRVSTLYSLHILLRSPGTDEEDDHETLTESSLAEPVQGLLPIHARTLTSVHLSPCFNTPSITECLSKAPNLCDLTIGNGFPMKQLRRDGICGDGERFPSLRYLSFHSVFPSFYPMFVDPVISLVILTVSFFNTITPDDVKEFISFVVLVSPLIQSLTIEELHTPTLVPWCSIQPISHCKWLSSLTLNWICISLSMEELTGFVKSRTWSCLQIFTADPLRLQDILLYAEHCPNLRQVGLHLDDRVEFCDKDLPHDTDDTATFAALDNINLAYGRDMSRSNSRIFAKFFYRICNKRLFSISRPEIEFANCIYKSLAEIYEEEKCRTGEPMSTEVEEFVDRWRRV